MKKILTVSVAALLLAGLVYAARYRVSTTTSTKPQVVASIYPLAYFASQIVGDIADVTTVTPAGAEPHDYEPSTQDTARMERARLVILNGGHLEAWGDSVKENLKNTGTLVVSAGDSLATRQLTEDGVTGQDPHVWLDPILAQQEVTTIAQALETVDPVNALTYKSNAQDLTARLAQLDTAYATGLQSCQKKDIVTSHAAFGYLTSQYGLNQVAITGLSPDAQPSAQQLAQVATFVEQHKVGYIFFESLVSPKLSDTIATETGAKTLELNPLEGLTDDEVKQGKDYFSVMHDNLSNLQLALVCQK